MLATKGNLLIAEAGLRIAPVAHRTPVLTSRSFTAAAGVRTFFKCENLQRGGSFKIRGAANLVFSLSAAELGRGVVAYSSGNHGQAVAIAALQAGRRVEVRADTIADGLRSLTPAELTFPILQRLVEEVILVSDDEIRAAMRFLLMRMKILVEPSGAAAAAAVLLGKLPEHVKS